LTEILALEVEESGVASFSISPGAFRAARSEGGLNDREAMAWPPWFAACSRIAKISPLSSCARLVLQLASGRYDALSGSFIHIEDDLDRMLARASDIRRDDLYLLRIRTLR
jgi:hypothetical protein